MTTAAPEIVVRDYEQEHVDNLIAAGINPVAARVLAARGVTDSEQINPSLSDLAPVTGAGLAAAKVIAKAVTAKQKICIIGDYDADGLCGTALAVLALRTLGVEVTWVLGNRKLAHRSLDPVLIQQAIAQEAQLIISVDGGTSAHAGAAVAKEAGVDLVITDHHLEDSSGIAAATAVANPQLPDSGFPIADLCGTAVIMLVLREVYRLCGATQPISVMMDLVAVATIGDSMPLNNTLNRKFVINGLKMINKGRCRPAFKALLREQTNCDTKELGTRVLPLLNAGYRADMEATALELLLTDNLNTAYALTQELIAANRSRNLQGNSYFDQALAMLVENTPTDAIVVYHPTWEKGFLGSVAKRIVAIHHLPTVVLGGEDILSGSVRSTRDISIHAVLAAIEEEAPGLLGSWGGHAKAAGVQVTGDLEKFRQLFCKYVAAAAANSKPPALFVDGELTAAELTAGSFATLLTIPWGRDFARPEFIGAFIVEECRPTNKGYRYVLSISDGRSFSAWCRDKFGKVGKTVRLRYAVLLDEFNRDSLFILPKQVLEN